MASSVPVWSDLFRDVNFRWILPDCFGERSDSFIKSVESRWGGPRSAPADPVLLVLSAFDQGSNTTRLGVGSYALEAIPPFASVSRERDSLSRVRF